MIPEIGYIRPRNLHEALEALGASRETVRVIAGGTDIIPGFHINSRRFRDIQTLVDISGLPDLTFVNLENDGLHIGGAVTFTDIVKNPLIREKYPLLAQAASQVGSVQIRNRATIVGNFVNNAPCADSVPPLLVYDAVIKIQSTRSEKTLPLEDFLLKPYKTQLQPDEIVSEIVLPPLKKEYRGEFYKLGRRRSVAISRITLAVLVKLEDLVIEDIRIASGAVTPIGMRFRELEEFSKGKTAEIDFLKELSVKLGEEIMKITGLRWSSAYKLPVVQQMFYLLLRRVCNR